MTPEEEITRYVDMTCLPPGVHELRKCGFTDCDRVAAYYVIDPAPGGWGCDSCDRHVPVGWHIVDVYDPVTKPPVRKVTP